MHIFQIDIFGLHIAPTWYGLMYALGFLIGYIFVKKMFTFREKDHSDTLLWYIFLGVVIGGRLGYVLLYSPVYFLEHPLEIIAVWQGGMSFHGGFIGVVLAMILFTRRYQYSFWRVADVIAVLIPFAIGLGRLGNWINGELPGYTPYNGLFSMYRDGVAHFPSPLLEFALEGVVLSVIMIALYKSRKLSPGVLSGVFATGYAIARLIAEQYRLPDAHIGYLFGTGWLTLGMIYTLPILILGIWVLVSRSRILQK